MITEFTENCFHSFQAYLRTSVAKIFKTQNERPESCLGLFSSW